MNDSQQITTYIKINTITEHIWRRNKSCILVERDATPSEISFAKFMHDELLPIAPFHSAPYFVQ